jgi:hypothetical protein
LMTKKNEYMTSFFFSSSREEHDHRCGHRWSYSIQRREICTADAKNDDNDYWKCHLIMHILFSIVKCEKKNTFIGKWSFQFNIKKSLLFFLPWYCFYHHFIDCRINPGRTISLSGNDLSIQMVR